MTAPSGRYRPTEPAEVDRVAFAFVTIVALVRRKVRCKRSRCAIANISKNPKLIWPEAARNSLAATSRGDR
jgi:hypothetical protein